ncbi:MAG: right-handed parallel beta-helix repeat-containing protein, partial [Paraglaciecola sp.]
MTLVSIVIISLFSINAIAADKVIQVQNVEQLFSALRHGNKYGNTHIKLQDGTYIIDQSLIILGNGITLSSGSGNRRKVIISGLGMKKTKQVNNLIRVSGKHFTLDGITLQFAGNHLIQIAGEQDADFPTLRNCVLKVSYEQLFKVSYNRKTKVASDNGL